ncbi:ABC transporter substrate-binding protein [Sinirhodobacter populi]|uniref:ABC transporter substrate-binding protein n=1 Tax=Paenirhodobacter populi TaxID=2306993 RepID=A0A443K4J9_9RHOB|nr:ABC transporter substrate-binding protein [Sinirhodobacter populi]RWR27691.1 ABC transporter substrate-binding protein [Sinirhodobacter populi]
MKRRDFLKITTAGLMMTQAMRAHAAGGNTTFVASLFPEPSYLNTVVHNWFPNSILVANIYDGLLEYDDRHQPLPSLATAWEVTDGGKTIRFELRRGVTWHDGKPFTAHDVKVSLLEGWKKLHSRGRITFAAVEEVETPDDHTVILRLSNPSPVLFHALSAAESPVLPAHLFEGTDFKENPVSQNPVGTGAFRFVKWDKVTLIELERNTDFWGEGLPHIDRLIYRFIPDEATRAAALETEEIHYAIYDPVAYSDLDRIKEIPFLQIETRGYDWQSQVRLIEFNLRNPILADLRVRQAIAHAIDKQGLIDTVVNGYAIPAVSPVPSPSPYHSTDVQHYDLDRAKAEALLDEAGHPRGADGVRFKLRIDREAFSVPILVSEYIRQSLKPVGIEIDIVSRDNASFLKAVYTDFDFDINNINISTYLEPQIGLPRLYWSKAAKQGVSYVNASGYVNAELDKVIEDLQFELDVEKRKALFTRFQQIAQTDLPILPLFEVQHFSLINKKVSGVPVVPEGFNASLKSVRIEG